jgi:Zn-finger nucleic acid-binding protein
MTMRMGARECPRCGATAARPAESCARCQARLLTERCFLCGTWRFRSDAVCTTCERAAEGPVAKRCPVCRTKLSLAAVGSVAFEECQRCGGVWLEHGSLDRMREEVEGTLSAPPRRPNEDVIRYVPCASCEEIMNRTLIPKAGVVIDICVRHGVWFDRDELLRVLAARP